MNENYVYKMCFRDLESEENRLNEMAEKGLAMKSVEGGFLKDTYRFEPCDRKYIYRVDYNPEGPVMEEITSHYVMFVKETYGAEYVCCARGKVYFRKAEEKGDFPPVYTSAESRLSIEKKKFYQSVTFTFIFIIDILMCCTPRGAALYLAMSSPSFWLKAAAFVIASACIVSCIREACRHYKKIAEIKEIMK